MARVSKFILILMILSLTVITDAFARGDGSYSQNYYSQKRNVQPNNASGRSGYYKAGKNSKYNSKINPESSNDSAEDISNLNDQMKWGDACENFASDKDLGKWGMMILRELDKNPHPTLLGGSKDLFQLCPAYPRMDLQSRKNLWVLILNAMAFYESSCESNSRGRGPNGRLIGLLQLHVNKEQFYAPECRKGDGKTPNGTFRCGLSMLNGQLERGEPLFSRKSYWDVLRPQGQSGAFKKIRKAIWNYPQCHEN